MTKFNIRKWVQPVVLIALMQICAPLKVWALSPECQALTRDIAPNRRAEYLASRSDPRGYLSVFALTQGDAMPGWMMVGAEKEKYDRCLREVRNEAANPVLAAARAAELAARFGQAGRSGCDADLIPPTSMQEDSTMIAGDFACVPARVQADRMPMPTGNPDALPSSGAGTELRSFNPSRVVSFR